LVTDKRSTLNLDFQFGGKREMKLTSETEQLRELKSLIASRNSVTMSLESSLIQVRSKVKVTSASNKKIVFELSAGRVVLSWSKDGTGESMSLPPGTPDEHHVEIKFKNGLRLFLTEQLDKERGFGHPDKDRRN
jgi:hypothetical protein